MAVNALNLIICSDSLMSEIAFVSHVPKALISEQHEKQLARKREFCLKFLNRGLKSGKHALMGKRGWLIVLVGNLMPRDFLAIISVPEKVFHSILHLRR